MRNLELSYRLNGSYATCLSTDHFLTVDDFLYFKGAFKRGLFFLSFPFPSIFFTFFLSRPELCCSLIAPVPCAMEMKRHSVEHNTFAAVPQGDYKTGGLISGRSPLLMLLQSPVLWQPKELHPLELEWGGGTRESAAPFGTSSAAAGALPARVFIQRCRESRVPCSTKATSSSLPMSHCSLRGLATIPGPPEG